MNNRIILSQEYLTSDGLFELAIDEEEQKYVNMLMEQIMGSHNFVSNIGIMHNPRGRTSEYIAPCHEYLLLYAKNKEKLTTNDFIQNEEELSDKYDKKDKISRYRELPLRRSGSESMRSDRPNLFYPIYYNDLEEIIQVEKPNNKEKWIKILPIDTEGLERRWRWSKEKVKNEAETELIVKENNGSYNVYTKDRVKKELKPKSFWYGSKYDASSHGTLLIKNIFGSKLFDYPKSIHALYDALTISTNKTSYVLDFFAGSGTTAHAVLKLNKDDRGNRKYILIEMGKYFDDVTKMRIKKLMYSNTWKDGKPESRDGYSHIFKYQKLEQYEDTIENIKFESNNLRLINDYDDYLIKYMLDYETKSSVLNIDKFDDPFNYKITITENKEKIDKKVNLIETFNYLIGLKVKTFDVYNQFNRKYKVISGKKADESVLVIWRKTIELDLKDDKDFIENNLKIDDYKKVYINGDNYVEKSLLIEESFKKLMLND